jgi:hypothetical protein
VIVLRNATHQGQIQRPKPSNFVTHRMFPNRPCSISIEPTTGLRPAEQKVNQNVGSGTSSILPAALRHFVDPCDKLLPCLPLHAVRVDPVSDFHAGNRRPNQFQMGFGF